MAHPRDSLFTGPSDPTFFERVAGVVTRATGTPWAFIGALAVVVGWGASGPFFGFSQTWQLVINSFTTIVTFLMVFVIQQSQNKDTIALQLKLNELIASSRFASNRLIDIEDLSDRELEHIKAFYVRMARRAKDDREIHESHSLDEAGARRKPHLPADQQ
jgi:low affinity Fe/Cu permease